jgi:hypothetical protein
MNDIDNYLIDSWCELRENFHESSELGFVLYTVLKLHLVYTKWFVKDKSNDSSKSSIINFLLTFENHLIYPNLLTKLTIRNIHYTNFY